MPETSCQFHMFCSYQEQRTMHLRVWPSTVAVTVVVPLDTAVTVPSPEIVATEESEMLQVGLELVPLTLSCHLAPPH